MSQPSLIDVLLGPQLVRLHKVSHRGQAEVYNSNSLENNFQFFLSFLRSIKNVLYYTTFFWVPYYYNKGFLHRITTKNAVVTVGTISILYLIGLIGRMFGRLQNQVYLDFMKKLKKFEDFPTAENKIAIKDYDFEFNRFPVEFTAEGQINQNNFSELLRRIKSGSFNPFYEILGGIFAYSFGIRVTYPGSTALMNLAIGSALEENRAKLVEENKGIRGKVVTLDNNSIDTLFVDKRNKSSDKGKYLVICCEGNAGFYEVGIIGAPMKMGYSVLGWNHPGFGESTGQPFPAAEKNAIDAVMLYALQKLNFPVENIYLSAWSIGGYTAIHAATKYPEIKGLILDATFHDILPFGINMMHPILSGVTKYTIRNYLNMCNSELLKNYSGEVLVIRRTKDEIMNIDGVAKIESNMGNLLIENLLWTRYGPLFQEGGDKKNLSTRGQGRAFDVLWDWLSAKTQTERRQIECEYLFDEKEYAKKIIENEGDFHKIAASSDTDEKIKMIFYLLERLVMNIELGHCIPLTENNFKFPLSITNVPETNLQSSC